jgi:hypothetical protein
MMMMTMKSTLIIIRIIIIRVIIIILLLSFPVTFPPSVFSAAKNAKVFLFSYELLSAFDRHSSHTCFVRNNQDLIVIPAVLV